MTFISWLEQKSEVIVVGLGIGAVVVLGILAWSLWSTPKSLNEIVKNIEALNTSVRALQQPNAKSPSVTDSVAKNLVAPIIASSDLPKILDQHMLDEVTLKAVEHLVDVSDDPEGNKRKVLVDLLAAGRLVPRGGPPQQVPEASPGVVRYLKDSLTWAIRNASLPPEMNKQAVDAVAKIPATVIESVTKGLTEEAVKSLWALFFGSENRGSKGDKGDKGRQGRQR